MFYNATSFTGDVTGWTLHPECDTSDYLKGTPMEYYTERRQRTMDISAIVRDELIETTWEPGRVMDWCLDIDERDIIGDRFEP